LAVEIVRASQADIPFIMATERTAGYEGLVGRWEQERHERELGDAGNAYFIGLAEGKPVGFVIVQHWGSTSGATLIKRIAVADTGKKIGRELLSQVIATILAETGAQRIWLDVRPHNVRAQRSYSALGFQIETREGSDFPGSSEMLLMVLRRR
jgi:ribosomal protein S18 acetylase RimI-like enzyme